MMNIADIILKTKKPRLYEKGNSYMWTDKHISRQLLNIHLNPDIDLASRKMSTIRRTTKWILDLQKYPQKLKLLDLGCGPGLYSEIFTYEGHDVTGVDISKSSIEYAQMSAEKKDLDINYLNANYLELDFGINTFDIILLIYTDLGVLIPKEREVLLSKVFKALKQGGKFIFDVLKDNQLEEKQTPNNWEANNNGFWKDSPYLSLSESFLFKKQKVILYQHCIIEHDDNCKIYRFWTHFFNQKELDLMLISHGFRKVDHREDILPEGNLWNGNNVIFTIALK